MWKQVFRNEQSPKDSESKTHIYHMNVYILTLIMIMQYKSMIDNYSSGRLTSESSV